MGTVWRNCAEVREDVEMPFGVVSVVARGTDVLDGVYIPMGRGGFAGLVGSLPLV